VAESPFPSFRWRIQRSETVAPVAMAIAMGLLAALAAALFRRLIDLAHRVFMLAPAEGAVALFGEAGAVLVGVLAPAVGFTLVVWMLRAYLPTRGEKGGIPEVQHAVRNRAGRMDRRSVLVHTLASAVSIGSGGSVGREGPIVYLGGGIGSWLGQLFGLGRDQVRLLLASGVAGGVAATFNAPVAGVLFALEVILGDFGARSFGLVVLSAVSATALSGAMLGDAPAFVLSQPFALVSYTELGLYLGLGLLTGLGAVLYVTALESGAGWMERLGLPSLLRAFLGGLVVGCMTVFGSEYLLGIGYDGVDAALAGELTLQLLLLLFALKIVATAISLGSGASGGVFAPGLFVGAMLGGAFGVGVNALFPEMTAPSGAYALVGMAGLFGAAAHAPMSSVLIVFEMSDNYQIMLPLLMTVGLSYLVAYRLHPESLYSQKLRRLTGSTPTSGEGSVLDLLIVEDAMVDDPETVAPELSLDELTALSRTRRMRSWPVLDSGGGLVGIVTDTDLERALMQEGGGRTVGDIMTTGLVTLAPDDTLRTAFGLFSARDIQQIPVLGGEDGRTFLGALRRHEMIWAFKTIADEHERLLAGARPAGNVVAEDVLQVMIPVHRSGSRIAGRAISELGMPEGTLVTLVRRKGRPFVPRGNTVVEPGDVLVVVAAAEADGVLHEWIERMGAGPLANGGG